MRVLVIHGPNLNLLGERQPEIYGRMTLIELDDFIAAAARDLGVTSTVFSTTAKARSSPRSRCAYALRRHSNT